MNHRRILAALAAAYVAVMGAVLAWAGADYYRPARTSRRT